MKTSNYISAELHLSKKVIFQLLNKEVNQTESDLINQHLTQCELCRDAFNGLKQTPDKTVLNSLNNKWRKSHRHQHLKKRELNLQSFYMVFTFVLIIAIALIYLLFFNKVPVNAPVQKMISNRAVIVSSGTNSEVFMVDVSVDSIVDNNPSIEEVPEIKTQIKLKNRILISPAPERDATYSSQEISKPNVESKIVNEIPKLEIQGFLLRDYTALYLKDKEWEKLKNGVAARFAEDSSISDKHLNKFDNPYQTSYEDVFDAAFRNIRKGKYYKAIDDFTFVQQFFPNDLNCIFYKGLCYEYLKDFARAEVQFNIVINSSDDWWNEAALFHLALCKVAQNQIQQAVKLFQTIAEKEGFYKTRAEEQIRILQ